MRCDAEQLPGDPALVNTGWKNRRRGATMARMFDLVAALGAIATVSVGGYLARRWWHHQLRCEVPPAQIDWLFDGYAFLLRNLGGYAACSGRAFLTAGDFAPEAATDDGAELARRVFERVRREMGVQGWPCRLQRVDGLPEDHGTERSTVGTFSADGWEGEGVVGYRPALEERLDHLVPVFAHELSHYIILAADGQAPGGAEMDEPLTDLCTVVLGFGIFGTNAALEPVVDEDTRVADLLRHPGTMRLQRLAYLNQETFAYALAIAATLAGRRDEVARELTLPARLRFHSAVRHLDNGGLQRVEALRALEGFDVRTRAHPLGTVREYLELDARKQALEEELARRKREAAPRRQRKRRRRQDEDE